jgi:hypothetical protein
MPLPSPLPSPRERSQPEDWVNGTAGVVSQDFNMHSKWITMTHNPDLPPNPKGKPEIRVEFQWVQLATKSNQVRGGPHPLAHRG